MLLAYADKTHDTSFADKTHDTSLNHNRMARVCTSESDPSLTAERPGDVATSYHRRHALPQALFQHGLPGHQGEPLAVIKHRKAPAGQHHAAPVDAAHPLAVTH